MRFAAVDIGSNAVRLLLSQVRDGAVPPVFKKDSLIRFPLRLGDDAFLSGRISPEKSERLVRIMVAFRHLIDAYDPLSCRACATAALREAENREAIVRSVGEASGLELEVVTGREEAEIIYANHSERDLDGRADYLYIDVGGGSTQLTLFSGGRSVASRSFDIGAVRLLKDLVPRERWLEMKDWIKAGAAGRDSLLGIGSGGNINKIYLMAGVRAGGPLSLKKLVRVERLVSGLDFEERIRRLGLRPDRADVIVPALSIFRRIMKWADVRKIFVPFIGLSDGLIHQLYRQYKRTGERRRPRGGHPLPLK